MLLRRKISNLTSKFYPQINLNIIYENCWSIACFFRYKDIILKLICSNEAYKYSCAQCKNIYRWIYETSVLVNRTVFLDKQIFFEPFFLIGSQENWPIFLTYKVLPSQFWILSSANKNNIFLLENIFILQLKPSLNGIVYSTPLGISN